MTEFVKSAFQNPVTIKEVVENIHRKNYLLPGIQREFVWNVDQVIRLFDSLMQEYAIGTFLFWRVDKANINKFQFYEFVRNYHERDRKHNPKASVTGEENITSILDGQQRLTSFYVGLKGTYAYKIPWKRWDNDDAFPWRKLYLNLLSKSKEFDLIYDFRFLTPIEASLRDEETFWFEVGKVLDFAHIRDIVSFMRENGILEYEFAQKCLFNLWEFITQRPIITYYLETSQDLDKVLNIFIRVNSGGTPLSYSDLLLSIATAQWETKDAREDITSFVDDINRVGDKFRFNKDFVLKSCLVLSDLPDIAFKVVNFKLENMKKIENAWEDIKAAIRLSVDLISSFGYNYQTLTSANAIIPISYYIIKLGNPQGFVQSINFREDREKIEKWLRIALIKRTFSGQPDNVLRPIRTIIRENHKEFPFKAVLDKFRGTPKSFTFVEEDIESLLFSSYGRAHTFSVLSLLYPTLDYKNRFHIDHIFPKSLFRRSELQKRGIPESIRALYCEITKPVDVVGTGQRHPNQEKSYKDFKMWLEESYINKEEQNEYMVKNFIPQDIDLSFINFKQFIEERNKLLLQKFKEALSCS